MVKIAKGVKPVPVLVALPDRDTGLVALTAWLDAQIQHATAQQQQRRLWEVGERLRKGEQWLAAHGDDDPQYERAYTLYRTLELEAEHLMLSLRMLRRLGWYWCGMTWEATKHAAPGWGDGIDEPLDTSSPEAIWRSLWREEPPGTWPPGPESYTIERRLGHVEWWNAADMRDHWKGLDS